MDTPVHSSLSLPLWGARSPFRSDAALSLSTGTPLCQLQAFAVASVPCQASWLCPLPVTPARLLLPPQVPQRLTRLGIMEAEVGHSQRALCEGRTWGKKEAENSRGSNWRQDGGRVHAYSQRSFLSFIQMDISSLLLSFIWLSSLVGTHAFNPP